MFPRHETAAQHKGIEALIWLTCHQTGQAALAADDTNASVELKACVSSKGRLVVCDVVTVCYETGTDAVLWVFLEKRRLLPQL